MVNSRNKGASGERELANLLKKYGHDARRGQQFCGMNGDPDVVWDWPIHIECKRKERLSIENALEQARSDCPSHEIPAVFHRQNRTPWKVTVDLDDFMMILEFVDKVRLVYALEGELDEDQ